MTSTVLHGGATTGTTPISSKKPLLTVLCHRFQASGLTFMGSSSLLNQIGTGKYGFTAHFPFSMKLLASARLIKAATTKHGSTSTFLGGTMNSPNVRSTIGGSSSTFCAVPSRQSEVAHQRFYERLFVAHVRECDLQRELCVCPHQVTC